MESILTALYPLASAIATPLALASTTILLFFSLGFAVVKTLGPAIERASGKDAVRVLVRLITYGFVLALVALSFAGVSWIAKSSYEKFYLKDELATAARMHIENGEVQLAMPLIERLVLEFPTESIGHSLRGTAEFRRYNYEDAASSFSRASALTDNTQPCDAKMRVDSSWSAALGASGDHNRGLTVISPHLDCQNLPSGARFNHAKLLFLSGESEAALNQLSTSNLLTSEGPPDYRDRAHFLLAALQISDVAAAEDLEQQAISSLTKANCLNPAFGRLALDVASAAAGSPEGELMQSFEEEINLVKNYLDTSGLRDTMAGVFSDLTNCV